MVLLAALSDGRHHHQRGGCASSFRGGVPGHSSSIISVRGSFRLAHTHHSSLLPRILTRWMESGLRQQTYQSCWWSPLCARWILGDVQWFRTRSLMHACGPSAVHSNALFELNALHASDQYDRMRGVCRGRRGEERAWERMGEAMWRVDRKGWKLVLSFVFFWSRECVHFQIAVSEHALYEKNCGYNTTI